MDLSDIRKKISPILRKYGVRRASLFGSVSRGEAVPQSDVDILVSLGKPMGLFSFMRMEREIEQVLGRKVDIVTENNVNKFLKPYITKELRTVYEER